MAKLSNVIDKVSAKDPRVQSFLTNIYVFLLVNLVLWVFIRPMITDINRIKTQRRQYADIKRQLELKVEKLNTLSNIVEEKTPELVYIPLLFPYDYNFSYLLAVLGNIAQDIGVELISINFNEQVSNQISKRLKKKQVIQVAPVTFNVTFNGNYTQMMYYIRLLEETPFMPQVVALDYSEKDIENQQREKTYTITFVVYKSNNKIINNPLYAISKD